MKSANTETLKQINRTVELHICALFLVSSIAANCAGAGDSAFPDFVTARDGKLFDNNKELRFISFDIPNLLEIEDNVGFTNENPWRLPDEFEINDALETVKQLGGTVVRTYVITVERTNDTPAIPRHVLAPGKFDEKTFCALDEVLAAANRIGVRIIIPLVDNWPWMGGRAEYARWLGKSSDDFWTDPQIIAEFEQTIHFVLTRTNTVTGVRYSDDKAILCWETGNEISSPAPWTRDVARYIKGLDNNHLVMDGFNASELRQESLDIPEVDIVTTHHYPGNRKSFADLIRANAERAKGKKVYIVGEFGFASASEMIDAMQAINDSGASGGLLWSLRFRDRDGGFYWHSEPAGANIFKAFHWPGSSLGDPYDERSLLAAVRRNAYAIRVEAEPPVPIPAPPHLLPLSDPAAISWQGSVGAASYMVERAAVRGGPWHAIANNVDEAFTQYHPQFSDEDVPAGVWYYRVRAKNDSGVSQPSNIGGPVKAQNATLVDELSDFSKTQDHLGSWRITKNDCRCAKEDAHRAAGVAGDTLVYQLPSAIEGFRVFAFFPKEKNDLKFSVSRDGSQFLEIPSMQESYFHGAGEYGYWQPVLYHTENIDGGTQLKIELSGATQVSRVEISRKALSR